jgi:hypothetical protein
MSETFRSRHRTGRIVGLVSAVCALIAVAGPAAATPPDVPANQGCHIQGSWLGQDTLGSPEFFIQFEGGANATSGPLAVEWITFDPTLGIGAPADSVTPAAGQWSKNAGSYDYTFVFYGLNSGVPVYALRVSGADTFNGCDTLNYKYTVESLPLPLDPLSDFTPDAVVLSGTGTKTRIRLVQPPASP